MYVLKSCKRHIKAAARFCGHNYIDGNDQCSGFLWSPCQIYSMVFVLNINNCVSGLGSVNVIYIVI